MKEKTITKSLLESHVELESGYEIKGFFTDSSFTNEFDFNKQINDETTIFVKIGQIEDTTMPENNETNNENKVENNVENQQKDETPKTGVESYLGIAMLVILFSAVTIVALKKKNIRG